MKKFLALAFFLLLSLTARAQTGIPTFQYVTAAPSGSCPTVPTPPIQIVYSTGAFWGCVSGTWESLGGGGGSGTPGGANTDVQVNASGMFYGDGGLTYNSATSTLTAANLAFPSTGVESWVTSGAQNVGFSNPSAGVLTLDTTAPGNRYGTLTLGFLNSASTSAAALVLVSANTNTVQQLAAGTTTSYAIAWPATVPTTGTPLLSCPDAVGGISACIWTTGGATIPATSNVLKGTGSAGSSIAAIPGTDYLAPGALPSTTTATTQSTGDNTNKVATDQFVLANNTGTPGGSNQQVQFNNSAVFGGDSTFTFNSATKTVGALTYQSGDGIHAGLHSEVGGTFAPPIPPNTVSDMGPAVATFAAYAKQWPAAGPANGSLVCGGALSIYSVSQMAFCLPINTSNGELGFVNSASAIVPVSDSVHSGANFLACNLFLPVLPPNVQGWVGSTASSTCGSYGLVVPSVAPSYGSTLLNGTTYGFMLSPGTTYNYSQAVWSAITTDAAGDLNIPANLTTTGSITQTVIGNNGTPPTIASATTIAPTTAQAVISGTTAIVNVTVPAITTTASTSKTCFATSSSSPLSCTWSTSPVSGETAMCYVFNQGSSSTFSGVSDSNSDVYSVMTALHQSSNSNTTTQGFYFQLSATITTTTVTLGAGTASGLAIACNTATGVTPISPMDGTCTGNGTSTNYSCSSAITTSRNGAYLYCSAANDDNNDTISPGAGFTAGAGYTGSFFNFVTQLQVQATAGSITPTFTALYNNDSAMDCAAFKPPLQAFTFAAGCFDSLATGAWTTTTGGNIENAITASSGSSYRWCYWPSASKWTVK